ncbi:hypothetical protein DAI22_07g130900 [Oryza sativa Japonica Group]|nr:hypothetical protein DAI22_07g130900 [Oryza sativa Japonica Group]
MKQYEPRHLGKYSVTFRPNEALPKPAQFWAVTICSCLWLPLTLFLFSCSPCESFIVYCPFILYLLKLFMLS